MDLNITVKTVVAQPASLGMRFLARLINYLSFLSFLLIPITSAIFSADGKYHETQQAAWLMLVVLVATFIMQILLILLSATTLGGFICGIKYLDREGKQARWALLAKFALQTVIELFVTLLSLIVYLVTNATGQHWVDKLVNVVAVQKKTIRPATESDPYRVPSPLGYIEWTPGEPLPVPDLTLTPGWSPAQAAYGYTPQVGYGYPQPPGYGYGYDLQNPGMNHGQPIPPGFEQPTAQGPVSTGYYGYFDPNQAPLATGAFDPRPNWEAGLGGSGMREPQGEHFGQEPRNGSYDQWCQR